jgi:hypothetical protein
MLLRCLDDLLDEVAGTAFKGVIILVPAPLPVLPAGGLQTRRNQE